MNIYHLAANAEESSETVENRYLDILRELKSRVSMPLTLKFSPQFSSPDSFCSTFASRRRGRHSAVQPFLSARYRSGNLAGGAQAGIVDLRRSLVTHTLDRAVYSRVKLSIAVTGGFHETPEVLKALLAGADVVHLCSTLLATRS